MNSKETIVQFLSEFKQKSKIFGILFKDSRPKNLITLIDCELNTKLRMEILEKLTVANYIGGPFQDNLNSITDLWVFGSTYKRHDLYIKI